MCECTVSRSIWKRAARGWVRGKKIKLHTVIKRGSGAKMGFLGKPGIPANKGVTAFRTTVLLALNTTCDGGALVTTQGTNFYLILSPILRGSRNGDITPAFLVAHRWADWLHNPCLLGGPQ